MGSQYCSALPQSWPRWCGRCPRQLRSNAARSKASSRTIGGVLPGVTVRRGTPRTPCSRRSTDANGVYRFPALPPGTYEISASLSGLRAGEDERTSCWAATAEGRNRPDDRRPVETVRSAARRQSSTSSRTPSRRDHVRASSTSSRRAANFLSASAGSPGTTTRRAAGVMIDGASARRTASSSTAWTRRTCARASPARDWSSTSSNRFR